ncbi:Amidase [Penicillium maclennaniae]|uniref:Amidase n=1 Tax=Penicillium maclennaniae TaxID=1343394 RepID=UPI0025425877|nr:Amidase [Penicillium maclennaniae]KAJ5665543.1 Amidase [Penicillium maclennaniae]
MGSTGQKAPWLERVAIKREACADRIPQAWKVSANFLDSLQTPLSDNKTNLIQVQAIRKSGILTERELHITEQYDVAALLSALASGELTSAEVTMAYCKRAAVAQQLVNCLTETMFEEAHARAEYLDNLRAQGKSAGPLHGLPISIKDNFQYKGMEATIGMVSFMDEVASANSPLVDILLNLGAVIYVKTNVPQTMMTAEADNNVFGRTLNPWNTATGPGGSSGGEGALIALRGSPLGVGTDIGGSVRIPAACCGTYGFRPSAGRVPNGGMRACTTSGMKFVLSCAGPLSLDLNGIETFFKAIFDAQPALYDSTVLDIPWRQVSTKPTLRIGLVPESPTFPLHPPVRRVLAEAASLLKARGHEIVTLSEEECHIMEANEVAWNIFTLDQGAMRHIMAAGEPPRALAGPHWERSTLPDMSALDSMGKLALLNTHRAELRESHRKLWLHHNLDICLAPPAQSTAVAHDTFGVVPYTTFLNLLDYPACVIPFGHVGELDAKETMELKEGQVAPSWNYELLKGAPCSIQVFTTTLRDEECLQMSKQIDECLKG